MKKLLLTILLLTPLFVVAENYFVEGAKWTSYSKEFQIPLVFSIEDTDFKAGYECHNLYCRNIPGVQNGLLTKIRTEGDKVYYLHDPDATEWDLLYDFGLEVGEECEISRLSELVYSNWPRREELLEEAAKQGVYSLDMVFPPREKLKRKVICTRKVVMPVFGGATVLYIENIDDEGNRVESKTNRNFWVDGIGTIWQMEVNCDYNKFPGELPSMMTFEVNGEEILRYNRYGYCGESAFYPGVFWTSDVEGFEGDGGSIPEFGVVAICSVYASDYSILYLQKPIKVSDRLEMKTACCIRIDGDQIYRVQYRKECPTGLAYDFAMQPGDVRQVVALESEQGTPATWVKCNARRASTAFPGRDEIHLAEFADAACTQHIGDGVWVTGIGSIYGVLANSRFAETRSGSKLKKVSQYDQVIWDGANLTLPAPAGIETVEVADADAPAVYYNLQGIRVDNPSNGVFIRVNGSKTTKVIL